MLHMFVKEKYALLWELTSVLKCTQNIAFAAMLLYIISSFTYTWHFILNSSHFYDFKVYQVELQ